MSDRDPSLLDDVTYWPTERRRTLFSRPPNRIERRAAATVRPVTPSRRRQLDDLDFKFSLEGGLPASPVRGYNPYDNTPRRNDVMPWNPRRR
jgi:hypothetical protein